MAGIGQRFTSADHSVSWCTPAQYTMGRTMMHDCTKPVTTYSGNINKRSIFGTGSPGITGAPTFSDIANFSSGYVSRTGSLQRNGEVFTSVPGGFMRNNYSTNPDSTMENGSMYFNALNYNGGSQRNFSESSATPALSTVNRTVVNDLTTNRVGMGGLTPTSVGGMASMNNARNCVNIFSNSVGSENGLSNISNNNFSSSRGVTLDPSEFPPILTSVGRTVNNSTSFSSSGIQPPLRKYLSIMSKGAGIDPAISQVTQFSHSGTNQSLEFSKQDFPALPGSQPVTTISTSTAASANTSSPTNCSLVNNHITSISSAFNTSVSSNRDFNIASTVSNQLSLPSVSKATGSLNCIQLLPNHLVTNIPKNMIYDQFGMIGLLKLIRVGDYDATLNMLAPGLDLSALHNNWQTLGELHSTFMSPCHDSCIGRPHDLDYLVPPEYLIRHLVTDHLPDPPMNQLSEETLFWLFYNCCREEVQLVVAKELYQREWRFHKKEQIWLTRIMGAQFTTDNNSEQGDYYFWDPQKAQKSTHQMNILYSDLDNAPATFRVSSNTLSAFVSFDLPGGGTSNSSNNATQLIAYQHPKTQQQQQQLQSYSSANNASVAVFSAPINSLPSCPTVGSLKTTGNAVNIFNSRQQPGLPSSVLPQSTSASAFIKSSQLNQSPNFYLSLGRSGQLNSSFTSRSSIATSMTTNNSSSNSNSNSNNVASISTSNEGNASSVSAFSRTSNLPLIMSENNVHNQSVFDNSQS